MRKKIASRHHGGIYHFMFYGLSHRAQLMVIDFREEVARGLYKGDPLRCSVRVLRAGMPPKTAFWRGRYVYSGSSVKEALSVVSDYVPCMSQEFPRKILSLVAYEEGRMGVQGGENGTSMI